MKRVFISHEFKSNPEENFKEVEKICDYIVKYEKGILPISPLHLFSFFDEEKGHYRESIMEMCFRMIDNCDEVWVYGQSSGCQREKRYAKNHGIKVVKKYNES